MNTKIMTRITEDKITEAIKNGCQRPVDVADYINASYEKTRFKMRKMWKEGKLDREMIGNMTFYKTGKL